jgi:hypothetical protein
MHSNIPNQLIREPGLIRRGGGEGCKSQYIAKRNKCRHISVCMCAI